MTTSSFNALLSTQIGNEFTASQQYIAVATWFANQDLPQLARYFYRQSVEERNHAMMMVQYMLDRDIPAFRPSATTSLPSPSRWPWRCSRRRKSPATSRTCSGLPAAKTMPWASSSCCGS